MSNQVCPFTNNAQITLNEIARKVKSSSTGFGLCVNARVMRTRQLNKATRNILMEIHP